MLCTDTTKRTKGRYYFATKDTPFYPGVHLLGSKTWNDSNWRYVQTLGEALDTPIKFDSGFAPEVVPHVVQLGDSSCIASGEVPSELLNGDQTFNGLPTDCFRAFPPESLTWDRAAAFDSCSVQAMYARVIDWIYAANIPAIFTFLGEFLGNAWNLTYFRGDAIIPDMVTAVSAQGALILIDGTDSFQQIALQGADLVARPRDVGAFSTSQFWYDSSDSVIRNLNEAGADPFGPIFLCGHSYGGTQACIAAVRYRLAQRNRVIRWLTFGCPKLGDVRLISRLGECPGLALANDTDIVPAIPPDLESLLPAVLQLGVPQFLVWPDWKAPPYTRQQNAAGQYIANEPVQLDTATIVTFIQEILLSLPHPGINGHLLQTYIDRIRLRCPDEEWPLKEGDYTQLFADSFIALEDGFLILQQDTARILTE